MIYTVTLNPALDYTVSVESLKTGTVNRTDYENILPGGKGINVSAVLKNLGFDSTALGFTAGFTGFELNRLVMNMGVECDFIAVPDGFTRINVKLIAGDETEINGKGPIITEKYMEMLFRKLIQLRSDDALVLAGSVPDGVSDRVYADILERINIDYMNGRNVIVIVDAAGKLLTNTLKFRPFLIKPNIHELGGIFGVNIKGDKDSAVKYARVLQEMGARNVLVSMAEDGAVLLTEDGGAMMCPAPEGDAINSVGAGDSMVAGFIAGWLQKHDYEYAFRTGAASGSASAFSQELAKAEDVGRIINDIKIYK